MLLRKSVLALEESHNDGHAKLKKDLDHNLVVSRVINSKKAKFGVDHARRSLIYSTRPTMSLRVLMLASKSLMLNSKLS